MTQSVSESETICCSETNIDLSLDWSNTQSLDTYDLRIRPVYNSYKDLILDRVFTFIKTEPTKMYTNKPNTSIDHLVTTYPTKISNHQVIKGAFSDHYPVIFTRIAKKPSPASQILLDQELQGSGLGPVECPDLH